MYIGLHEHVNMQSASIGDSLESNKNFVPCGLDKRSFTDSLIQGQGFTLVIQLILKLLYTHVMN